MTTTVMLTCGCAAHAVHENQHDGLPARHPSCVVHGHCSVAKTPNLVGRKARCAYDCKTEPRPSFLGLAFFEYQGPGSPASFNNCKHCGCYPIAHDQEALDRRDRDEGRKPNHHARTHAFEPRGPAEFDSYYCGCRGFD